MWLTYKLGSHLNILAHLADLTELEEGVNVVGVGVEYSLKESELQFVIII